MDDESESAAPDAWRAIKARSEALGFDMPSDARTGALLKLLAASKPGGRLLELGTGTGLATAWLLAGMDAEARLVTVDIEPSLQAVAREVLDTDSRVEFRLEDGLAFIRAQPPATFDLVFADAMPGKYEGLDDALSLVRRGGFFVGDDMLPQPNWPGGHQARVDGLVETLVRRSGWTAMPLAWGSGFVIAVRR